MHIWYIYMLSCSVLTSPAWYGPPDPGPRHNVPPLGYSRPLAFHICLLFPHLVKFLANTMQFNTTCNDYDSISQHSHQSTRTTGPQGGRGANHDHAQGGGEGRSDAGALLHIVLSLSKGTLKSEHIPSQRFGTSKTVTNRSPCYMHAKVMPPGRPCILRATHGTLSPAPRGMEHVI